MKYLVMELVEQKKQVVPHAGTWIEITVAHEVIAGQWVVPHAGTWIEIKDRSRNGAQAPSSFPTRERGLKSAYASDGQQSSSSFPTRERGLKSPERVTKRKRNKSFPTRERGLKLFLTENQPLHRSSFPTRERGLKSLTALKPHTGKERRSPRGNVD